MTSRLQQILFSLACIPLALSAEPIKGADAQFIDGQIVIPLKEIEEGVDKVNKARMVPPVVHSLPQEVSSYPVLSTEQAEDFSNYLADQINEYQLPGFAFAIVQDKNTVIKKTLGKRNIKGDADIDTDTLFNIGPATHALTSLLAATLATDNSTIYDRKVRKLNKRFRLNDPIAQDVVTIRHLLNMTAGLPSYADNILDPTWSRPEDVFEVMAQSPITARPGQAFSYSKVTVSSAGYLAAALYDKSGNPYEQYTQAAQEHLFIPTGMDTATFSLAQAKASKNYAAPHKFSKKDNSYQPVSHWEPAVNAFAPAVGLKASINDMIKWLSTELNQGLTISGETIAPAHAVKERWQPFQGKKQQQHGMGWTRQVYLKTEIIGNTGSYDRHTCGIGLLPEHRTGFVVLINANGPDASKMVQEVALGLTEMIVEVSSRAQ